MSLGSLARGLLTDHQTVMTRNLSTLRRVHFTLGTSPPGGRAPCARQEMTLLPSSNLLFRHPYTPDISPSPKSLPSPPPSSFSLWPLYSSHFTPQPLAHGATRADGQGALLLGQASSLVTTGHRPQSLVWHRQKGASNILQLPLQLHPGLPQVHCKSSASPTHLLVGSHRDTCLHVQVSALVPSGWPSFYVCKASGCPQGTARSQLHHHTKRLSHTDFRPTPLKEFTTLYFKYLFMYLLS